MKKGPCHKGSKWIAMSVIYGAVFQLFDSQRRFAFRWLPLPILKKEWQGLDSGMDCHERHLWSNYLIRSADLCATSRRGWNVTYLEHLAAAHHQLAVLGPFHQLVVVRRVAFAVLLQLQVHRFHFERLAGLLCVIEPIESPRVSFRRIHFCATIPPFPLARLTFLLTVNARTAHISPLLFYSTHHKSFTSYFQFCAFAFHKRASILVVINVIINDH